MSGPFYHHLVTLNRWQAALVLFAAGSLMALGFAPFHLFPVIFFSLPVLYLMLVTSRRYAQAIWRGFWFGYGYYMAGTWWIANALLVDADKFGWLLPFCVFGLSAVMAFWFMVFSLLVHWMRGKMSIPCFAALWVIVEYGRSWGIFGFPWNFLGYMGMTSLEFAQVASVVGTYGLSFVLALAGLLPVCWMSTLPHGRKLMATAGALLLLLGCYGYGAVRLQAPTVFTETVRLRVVQPNIPQDVKGRAEGRDLALAALGKLTTHPSPNGEAPDMTIWPETAYPFGVREGQENPLPKVKLLLTGAVRLEGERPDVRVWNSMVAMDGAGRVLASYDKHQLVPFGEFVPLRTVLPLDKITPGDTDFSRGEGIRTLNVEKLPAFSPLICYEVIFPWMAVDNANRPDWLLNITNDGWYGVTPGPFQHLEMSRMRAIEQGLPLVRAANSGVSVVTDGYGRIIRRLELNQRGFVDAVLPAPLQPTVYALYGEILPLLMILFAIVYSLFLYRPRQKINK